MPVMFYVFSISITRKQGSKQKRNVDFFPFSFTNKYYYSLDLFVLNGPVLYCSGFKIKKKINSEVLNKEQSIIS